MLTAVATVTACTPGTGRDAARSETADGTGPAYANAVVLRVVDGDTLDVKVGRVGSSGVRGARRSVRVRLIGINTPETVDPRRPAECYGHEASALTKALLPPGTPIRVERDAEARDDYGRLLAYVFRGRDHLFVNLELVRRGAAVPLRIEPNTAYSRSIAAAASLAERNGLGLWSRCPR